MSATPFRSLGSRLLYVAGLYAMKWPGMKLVSVPNLRLISNP